MITTRRTVSGKLTMVHDHGNNSAMETMAISRFKATCLAALERVRRTGRPLRVTRFGQPMADVVAATPERRGGQWLGALRGALEIRGGIVAPSSELARGGALNEASSPHAHLAVGPRPSPPA